MFKSRFIQTWPVDKPVPEGWVIAPSSIGATIHGKWSMIIRPLSWWERVERAFVRWIGPPRLED